MAIDLGKNRLVEIPRSGSEAPDGFTRIQLICELWLYIIRAHTIQSRG